MYSQNNLIIFPEDSFPFKYPLNSPYIINVIKRANYFMDTVPIKFEKFKNNITFLGPILFFSSYTFVLCIKNT